MSKIAKNYIYNILYQMFILLVPLVTAPYLTRTLGAVQNGVYSYVYSVTTLIVTICLFGLSNYSSRQIAYVRDNKEKLNNTFWELMGTRLILTIFCSIMYVIISLILNKYKIHFTIFYTYLIAYCLDCTWLYVGVEDMKWAVIKNAITKIITVIGIFLIVKAPSDIYKYIAIQGLSLLVSNLLAYSQIRLYVKFDKPKFENIKTIIGGSIILFLPSVASTIYLQSDKIMIELLTDYTEQVSFYDYSEKIITIPLTFITVLSSVMMPRLANEFKKGNKNIINELLSKATSFSLFLSLPMTFGIIGIADKLIPWYLGSEFLQTSLAIKYMAPIIITNTLSSIAGSQYFTATNQINILLKAQVSAALGNILINLILIPKYGFYGAAIATIITSFMCSIILMYFLLKQVKIDNIFKKIFKYFVISLVMYIIMYLITVKMISSPKTTIIQILVGVCTYISINYILKDENQKMITDFVKKTIKKGEKL